TGPWSRLALHLRAYPGTAAEARPGGGIFAGVCQLLARGEHDDSVCRPWDRASGSHAVQLQSSGKVSNRFGARDRLDADQRDGPFHGPPHGCLWRRGAFVTKRGRSCVVKLVLALVVAVGLAACSPPLAATPTTAPPAAPKPTTAAAPSGATAAAAGQPTSA